MSKNIHSNGKWLLFLFLSELSWGKIMWKLCERLKKTAKTQSLIDSLKIVHRKKYLTQKFAKKKNLSLCFGIE